MTHLAVRATRARTRLALAGVLALTGAAALIAPSAASAANMVCHGRIVLPTTAPNPADTGIDGPDNAVNYGFNCSDNLVAFSIISSKSMDSFAVNADVTTYGTMDVAEGQSFGCEGSFPSEGFGCTAPKDKTTKEFQSTKTPNIISGSFTTEDPPCEVGKRLRLWVVGVDDTGTISEPFRFRPIACPKATTPPAAVKPRLKRAAHRGRSARHHR